MKYLAALPIALIAGTASAGSVVATPPVTFIVSATGTATANATLNNTSSGGFTVELQRDPSCDAGVDFSVAGGSPFVLAGLASKTIAFDCTASKLGIERCLVHAIDSNTREPLADLLGVCEHTTAATLTPGATSLAFGSVQVGDSAAAPLSIKNNGATPITKLFFQSDALDDNFKIGLPCNPDGPACDGTITPLAPGASLVASVRCSPRTTGPLSANLEVASDTGQHLTQTIALSCTGTAATGPVLGVEPPTIAIAAPTEVVSTIVHATVYLSNLGTDTLKITDIRPVDVDPGAGFDWTFTLGGTCTSLTCNLSAGEQVSVDLAFDPSQIAARNASLLVSFIDNIGRTRSIPLTGIGQGATLQLFGTPTMLDLGSTPIGMPTAATLHFSNTGNRDTVAALAVAPPGPYVLAPPSMLTVTPTAVADVMATCTPTTGGTAAAQITAIDNDTSTDTSITVAATCTGTATPLYASPTSINLGEVRLDAGPITQTVDLLSNAGPLTIASEPHLDVANVNITVGVPATTTTPASFDVTVTPQAEGDLATHIIVADSVGDSILIPITGRIVSANYIVPKTLDVGTFCVNQPTAPSILSLTSAGTATFEVSLPTVPNTSGFDLGLTAPTVYPASILPSKTATISVTPERQPTATTLDAMVTWTTDTASPTATTEITANFIDSGGAIAPRGIDFGMVKVHLFSDDGHLVILQNCNPGGALELDPPTIKAPFFIDSPSFPTSLEPNETTTFSVGFHPTRVGTFVDTLAISSPQLPGMPLIVQLQGESITDPPPMTDGGQGSDALGTRTFYACACNSNAPGGGAPIVIALLLIVRRRR
ncbi:MAG: choice-of-anchor D domain-containing protein [Kofleriaceae bacterium]